jgi:hypothetical protein
LFVKFARKWVSSLDSVPSAIAVVHGIRKLHRGDRSYFELAINSRYVPLCYFAGSALSHVCLEAQASSLDIKRSDPTSGKRLFLLYISSSPPSLQHFLTTRDHSRFLNTLNPKQYRQTSHQTPQSWLAAERPILPCGFATNAMATSL